MNKYKITSIIFIFIIGLIFVITMINNRNEVLSLLKQDNIIEETNKIYTTKVAFSNGFLSLWSITQKFFNTQLLDDAEYGHIIRDKTGNLYFPATDVDISNYAQNTIDFSNFLKDKKISFAYIQAPNKVINGYSEDIIFQYNFSNKNADEFLEKLTLNRVDTLDLRKTIVESGIPKEKLFYKTDHHWTTPSAFCAFQEIVQFLKSKYHLAIDEKYISPSNFEKKVIPKCFLGSLGRRVGIEVAGLDDYVFIEPKFETNYEIIDGSIKKVISSGDFRSAIVIDKILNSDDVEANKHATYFEWDYGNLIIKNNIVQNNLKILLIKDSYALPVAAFLSSAIKELHMVDLRAVPTVDLKKYVEGNNFDVVVMLYNTECFNDTMFHFNKSS